ncbi:ROK family protein [Paraflavisolibacter sp. H34]|uniref:ROK family protein n=1 Tax=Huijunlia imazamoxiresistens TaxID=3127457 RepID=UPI00301ABD1A
MTFKYDKRTVLTLDAGGTNFVFSAIRGNEPVTEPLCLPCYAEDLEKCLEIFVQGFTAIMERLEEPPVAISFAFPGPADYPGGIIGGQLPNLPAFRGGVALGPFLEEAFGLPVFINNDGDLFAYGEALAGVLPAMNKQLEAAGSAKRFRNLLALTLGTGFGAGVVIGGELLIGDNSCGAEIFPSRNHKYPDYIVEESVSIRAVKRVYARLSDDPTNLTPKEIFDIAEGTRPGNREAARQSFAELGEIAGDAIANIIAMLDGLIVIGGGLAGAHKYFMPSLMAQLNGTIAMMDGTVLPRIPARVYNLEEESGLEAFLKGSTTRIQVHGTNRLVDYDGAKRTGVILSRLGASKAIMLGAYAFALNELDKKASFVASSLL